MTTNTHMNMQSEIYDARKALGGYLERTDLLLARSGLSRSERDETLGQIAEQFYDLLGVPIGEADRELTENAIAGLAPETAFELNGAMTLKQHLRAALYQGAIVPIFLNDHGRKRVAWSNLIKVYIWLSLLTAILFTITSMMMFGGPSWRGPTGLGVILFGGQTGLCSVLYWMYRRTPVEAMPRAEDWSATQQYQHRYAWLLISSKYSLFIIALYPTAYWLVSAILNRPAWPIDNELFVIVSVALGAPLFLLSMWNARQRRRNTRRFYNWDRQGNM